MLFKLIKNQLKLIFEGFTQLGNLYVLGAIALLFLFANKTNVFLQLVAGIILIYAAVILIRFFYKKPRPRPEKYEFPIENFFLANAFPSVHSARAVLSAVILWNHFGNVLLSWFIVLVALLVIYSRIYLKKHDWADVIAGSVLGGVVGWAVLWLV